MAVLDLPNGTLLLLAPEGAGVTTPVIAAYGARGITQTLELVTGSGKGAWIRRDVNGNLQSVADTRFRKYKSSISCTDGNTPALDGSWIGALVAVWCAAELSYPTGGSPQRPVVSGSSRTEAGITLYRPALTMLITDIKILFQEWAAKYTWTMDLEEV